MKKNKFFALFAMGFIASIFCACTQPDNPVDPVEPEEPVSHISGITITAEGLQDGSVTLTEGATLQLSTVITPAETLEVEVVWASSDETVSTVSDDGLLTAVAPGTATITVTSVADPSISSSITLTVEAAPLTVPIDSDRSMPQQEAESRR